MLQDFRRQNVTAKMNGVAVRVLYTYRSNGYVLVRVEALDCEPFVTWEDNKLGYTRCGNVVAAYLRDVVDAETHEPVTLEGRFDMPEETVRDFAAEGRTVYANVWHNGVSVPVTVSRIFRDCDDNLRANVVVRHGAPFMAWSHGGWAPAADAVLDFSRLHGLRLAANEETIEVEEIPF